MVTGSTTQYMGLSTDTKPEWASDNDLFLELDTGDFYYYTDEEWVKVGTAPESDAE